MFIRSHYSKKILAILSAFLAYITPLVATSTADEWALFILSYGVQDPKDDKPLETIKNSIVFVQTTKVVKKEDNSEESIERTSGELIEELKKKSYVTGYPLKTVTFIDSDTKKLKTVDEQDLDISKIVIYNFDDYYECIMAEKPDLIQDPAFSLKELTEKWNSLVPKEYQEKTKEQDVKGEIIKKFYLNVCNDSEKKRSDSYQKVYIELLKKGIQIEDMLRNNTPSSLENIDPSTQKGGASQVQGPFFDKTVSIAVLVLSTGIALFSGIGIALILTKKQPQEKKKK